MIVATARPDDVRDRADPCDGAARRRSRRAGQAVMLPDPMLRVAETLEARAEAGEPLTVKEMWRIAERLRSWAGLAARITGQPLAPALPNVLPDNVVRLPERAG